MRSAPLAVGLTWLLVLLGPLLVRAGWIPLEAGLGLCALGGLSAVGLSAAGLARRLRQRSESRLLLGTVPLAVAFVGLAPWAALRFPWMADVTTSAEAPPLFSGLAPVEQPGTEIYDARHRRMLSTRYATLQPVPLRVKPETAIAHALVAARSLPGWRTGSFDLQSAHLEGTLRSPLFGIESQIVIDARREGKRSALHVRSRSLLTSGDFGENARVIRRFLDAYADTWVCRPKPPSAG